MFSQVHQADRGMPAGSGRTLKETDDIRCTMAKHKAKRELQYVPHLSGNCGVVRADNDQCG